MKKFFVFLSHPIHYHTSIYKLLAKEKNLNSVVYFYSNFGLGEHFDPKFKTKIDFKKQDILEGYKYYFLKNLSRVKNFGFFDFINYEIPKIILKEKPDYVLINSWSYFSDWLVIFSCILSKTKLCLRSENPLCHEFKKSKWKIWIKKILLGFLFKNVDIFFYIGEENKNFLKFYGAIESKMVFTPYAVDNERFKNEYEKLKDKKEELRKELNIPQDAIVILFVGKLIPKKRPIDLLKAYELLSKDDNINQKIALLYIGEGELRKEIENYVKDKNLENVFITGFINQLEISKYYAISDIFVLPSEVGETWGLVVNEAMNFGLPIIISDLVGCSKDLVKHNENGYTFKCGDINQLANCLKELIIDNQKRNQFGKKSFDIIKEYSYQKSAENIKNILK